MLAQLSTRESKAKPAIEAITDRMQKALDRLVAEVQRQALLYQESVRDPSELKDTTGVELVPGSSGAPSRPMVVIKQEKLDRAACYARAMQELSLLGSCIRLSDYMMVAGVVSRTIACVEDLLSLLASNKVEALLACSL